MWNDDWMDRGLLDLGRTVRNARRSAGWSQRQLADRAGLSQSSISRLERGLLPGLKIKRLGPIVASLGSLVIRSPSPREEAARSDPAGGVASPPADVWDDLAAGAADAMQQQYSRTGVERAR